MNFIPLTVVDDFLESPDSWVDFANSCEYNSDEDGRWPGKRTDPLHEIDADVFAKLCIRYFSLFFDFKHSNISWNVSAYFQKIKQTADPGWIHYDSDGDYPIILSSIVYLNRDINSGCGTSLYSPKHIHYNPDLNLDKKKQAYKGIIGIDESVSYCLENNRQYDETVRVNNKFNRLITFDASEHHGANLSGIDDGKERLTLVFFVHSVSSENKFPLERMRRCR